MSLTPFDPESQRDVALLQELLHKREYHLAELIDEVVFAEQERFKAVQEAHNVRELATHLENAFDKLLQYHITMHKEVLLPTLVASVAPGGTHRRRSPASLHGGVGVSDTEDDAGGDADATTSSNAFLADLLAEPQLSRETKQLLQAVMQQRGDRSGGGVAVPILSPSAAAATDVAVRATHRAIVLSDSLLKNQETLSRLLRGIQDQAEEMLGRWNPGAEHGAAVTARADPNVVLTPSPRVDRSVKKRTADAATVAPFRLEHLHQHSDRAREIEESLRKVEEERDNLQRQLRDREHTFAQTATATSSKEEAWRKERVHLKQELAFAQQRALEEQARCRELTTQVAQLEKIAATSPISAASMKPAACSHCEKARVELKRKSAEHHAVKAAWKAEEQRLNGVITSLQQQVQETQKQLERTRAQPPPPPPPPPPPSSSASEPPRYPVGPSGERKIGQLEATVAAMKADLQIMEMRMSIVQDEREAERRRILAAHEHERERLRRERDECQKIIDKMARELQGLSRSTAAPPPPAITSASF